MFSPETTTHCYEIWLFAPGEPPELLNECRSYRTREGANAVLMALVEWFHQGQWVDAVLDGLPPDVCDDLFARRQGFKAQGIDPADVGFHVHRTERRGNRIALAVPDLDADDEDENDTPLEVVPVVYSNCLDG